MKIKIEGYRNIEKLELSLTDKKINMIFGMSGSGKSSISGALNFIECEDNKTIGANIDQAVSVDGSTDIPKVSTYNKNNVTEYVINKNTEDSYKIFIDSMSIVKKAEKSLRDIVKDVIVELEKTNSLYNSYLELKKELGSNLNTDKTLRKTSKILSLEKAFKTVKSNKIIDEIEKLPEKKLDWLKSGMNYMGNESECPFCDKYVSKKKIRQLNRITTFEAKPLDSVMKIQKSNANELLGGIDLSLKGIEKTKKALIDMIVALNQYDKIKSIINDIQEHEYKEWTSPIVLTNEFKEYFPELYKKSDSLFKNMNTLKQSMEKAQAKTKKVLSRRLNKINRYIKQMSIPYEIQAEYANNKIKSYSIIHNDDMKKLDRSKSLSDGEQAIMSLILFVFRCKSDESKLIVIDDPASSYDDFRRSQIFKLIQNELKGRTILLLSHDNVFAKYAVLDKYNTDKIYYFENYGGDVKLTEICKDDFDDFNEFVFNRLKNVDDYYQKIINLRMLFEYNHRSYPYKYLSGILHRKSKHDLLEDINKLGTTEDRIIELIKKKYNELQSIQLPNYEDNIEINTKDYSVIEKGIWARDNSKNELEINDLVDEMNEFAHINSSLKICLNPYKYTFCTKRLYDFLIKL